MLFSSVSKRRMVKYIAAQVVAAKSIPRPVPTAARRVSLNELLGRRNSQSTTEKRKNTGRAVDLCMTKQ